MEIILLAICIPILIKIGQFVKKLQMFQESTSGQKNNEQNKKLTIT